MRRQDVASPGQKSQDQGPDKPPGGITAQGRLEFLGAARRTDSVRVLGMSRRALVVSQSLPPETPGDHDDSQTDKMRRQNQMQQKPLEAPPAGEKTRESRWTARRGHIRSKKSFYQNAQSDPDEHVFFLSEINQAGQISHPTRGGGAGQGAGIIDEK